LENFDDDGMDIYRALENFKEKIKASASE